MFLQTVSDDFEKNEHLSCQRYDQKGFARNFEFKSGYMHGTMGREKFIQPNFLLLPQCHREKWSKGSPEQLVSLSNSQVRPCPRCKKDNLVTSRWHLKYHYNQELPHINAIWRNEICPTEGVEISIDSFGQPHEKPLKRQKILNLVQPIITKHIMNYNQVIKLILGAS